MKKQIIIVGGGAAGSMAALSAAREGADVTILERNEMIGRKILSTGNGKCNFSNTFQTPECYRSDDPDFAWSVIQKYPETETISCFEEMGIIPKDRNGYLYPRSEQAASVREVLEMALKRAGVRIITGMYVTAVEPKRKGFTVICQNKEKKKKSLFGDAVILTTGSKAASKLGSDGSGYDIAKMAGHTIVPVVPALVQLRCREKLYRAVAGVRTQAKVTLFVEGKEMASDTGELQLTDYGISGIPVFQISRYAAKGLYRHQEVWAELDFVPEYTEEEFDDLLKTRQKMLAGVRMEEYFTGIFQKKLSGALLKRIGLAGNLPVKELKEEDRIRLVRICKHFKTFVDQTNSFEQAQICAGGVDTREIDPDTMESHYVKNLFFAGEILDVDGICGGYNLQWAWSSGYLAGKGAANA